MLRRSIFGVVAAVLVVSASAVPVRACTRPMAMAEMAGYSAQVLTVRIEGTRSYWAEQPRRIETEITLIVEEALKGERATGERFTITTPGGSVGEWEMRICCAPQFEAGKSYVMFLLPEYRTHPVVGMSRGVFEVVTDAGGARRMMSADGAAVIEVGADGLPVLGRGSDFAENLRTSQGVRVVEVPTDDVTARAMTYEGFKAAIVPALAKSHAYPIDGPVARRVPVNYAPVEMVVAQEGDAELAEARGAKQPVSTAPPREASNEGSRP